MGSRKSFLGYARHTRVDGLAVSHRPTDQRGRANRAARGAFIVPRDALCVETSRSGCSCSMRKAVPGAIPVTSVLVTGTYVAVEGSLAARSAGDRARGRVDSQRRRVTVLLPESYPVTTLNS